MKFYLDPQPVVYEKRFDEGCHLCLAGGIRSEEGTLDKSDLGKYMEDLGKNYRRIYDLNVFVDTKNKDNSLSFAYQLTPIDDRIADVSSAHESWTKIPDWLSYMLEISEKNGWDRLILRTSNESLETKKKRWGIESECLFMAKLEDRFNPDKHKDLLTRLIGEAIQNAMLPEKSLFAISGHLSKFAIILTGEVSRIVIQEGGNIPDYYI